jgi:hypothetical protein
MAIFWQTAFREKELFLNYTFRARIVRWGLVYQKFLLCETELMVSTKSYALKDWIDGLSVCKRK